MNPASIILIAQTLTSLAQAGVEISGMLETAQTEGRDLTDEELARVTALRQAAVARALATD